jgi:hypothetical protein
VKSLTFTRELPLIDSYDVVVAGGGPAGCTAAIAAAREGTKTLLIESTGSLGGMGTSALVPAWCPFSDREKIIYRGLAQKIFEAGKKHMSHVPSDAADWVAIDVEALKRVYDEMVSASGASILFQTQLCSVETDGNGGVTAIVVSNKQGLGAFTAKVYVDATGDGDLAAWAGAAYEKGDSTGEMMPVTHCFLLSNVDSFAFEHGQNVYTGNKESPIHKILASGKYPLVKDNHMCAALVGPGTVGFNAGHLWDIDGCDPFGVSRGLMEGRRLAAQLRDGLAEFHPAFANSHLVSTGSLLGVRETRRILGDYVLTLEDYMRRTSFPDEICRNSYFLDIHAAKHEVEKMKDSNLQWERFEHYKPGESHGIPYRCLTPRDLTNVLVAGRSISCERIVQGSVRVMPVCLAMGEAAGMAAAMAAKDSGNVHQVDVQHLRTRLREEGAYLP